MRRRIAAAVLIGVAVPAALIAAQRRAVVILNDGERISATMVLGGEARKDIRADRQELSIRTQEGTEVAIPLDQVAMIDFVGGEPLQQELAAAPSDAHLVAMRDGTLRRGHLVDFVWGDTVTWETERGVVMGIPMNEVRRIYVNADRARELYRVAGADSSIEDTVAGATGRNRRLQNRAPRGSATSARLMEIGAVTVSPRAAWTDSGITVRRGEFLVFDPTGTVQFSRDRNHVTGPEGSGARAGREAGLPLTSEPVGSLIGRVGPNGAPFAIGAGTHDIEIPANGRLYLGVNDDGLHDNSGTFEVVIYR